MNYEDLITDALDKLPKPLQKRFETFFYKEVEPNLAIEISKLMRRIIHHSVRGYIAMIGLSEQLMTEEEIKTRDLGLKPCYERLIRFIEELSETERIVYGVRG